MIFGFLPLLFYQVLQGTKASKTEPTRETSLPSRSHCWANLKEVNEAQTGLVNQDKIAAALEAMIKAPPKAAATTVVVPRISDVSEANGAGSRCNCAGYGRPCSSGKTGTNPTGESYPRNNNSPAGAPAPAAR